MLSKSLNQAQISGLAAPHKKRMATPFCDGIGLIFLKQLLIPIFVQFIKTVVRVTPTVTV
jgi:hypothetical protein